jgi:hypothetical protein
VRAMIAMKAYLALWFIVSDRQSRKIPVTKFPRIWTSADTSDARARDRTEKYNVKYDPTYERGKVP